MTGNGMEELETKALKQTAELAATMRQMISSGGNTTVADHDTNEMVGHIHNLQRMIMQNVVAKDYPKVVRRLGASLADDV